MPVSDVSPVIEHIGNGVTTVFPYGYKILAATDMTVWLDDVLQTGGYTVSGVGVDSGGNVTFSLAPAASVVVRLQRNVSLARTTDYQAGGAFREEQVDADQDKQTMQIQQVNEAVGRAIKFPPGSPPASVFMPDPESLQLIGWNEDASELINYDPTDFATLAATSNWNYKTVIGDGTAMLITLDDNPGVIANLDISVGGITQTPVADYTVSGKDVQFVGTVPLGAVVLIRYGTALPQGFIDQSAVIGSAYLAQTYAEMQAYSGDKTLIYCACRSTPGDGGHGVFRVQTSGTLPTVNGGTVLSRTAGGVLVLLDTARPEHFGAKASDPAAAATNATALNAYAMWCMSRNDEQDYRGGPYIYNATLDLTLSPNRNAVLVGDCNDMNNDGIYSLICTGSGIAIKGKCVFLRQMGVAGTLLVTDAIPAGNTAVDVTESFTHRDSYIRNFDKGYVSRGGFYNTVRGGRIVRTRRLYDFTNNPGGVYNFTADAAHDGFVDGVVANAGAGPVRLGGSWEAFTGQIVKNTAGTPRYKVILDNPYIENYPALTVAAGLTANPADTYISPYAFLTRDSSVSGRAVIYANGFTSRVFYAVGGYPVLDIDIDWRETPGCPLLVFAPYIKTMNIRGLYEDALYASTTVVDGGAQNEMNAASTSGSMGQYLRPDGTIVRHGRAWTALTLLNSWANGASVKALSYKVMDSTLYIVGYMNGSAATSQVVAQLPTALLASIPDAFHWFPVNSPSTATQGRIIKSSGDLRIETTGVNGMVLNVAIPLK